MSSEIEILSATVNCPVVKMPGRKFSGIVRQGDSLKILLSLIEEIEQLSIPLKNDEIDSVVGDLKGKLTGYVKEYESAMQARGQRLPYVK